jgi:HEAT repeat protein
LPEAETEALTKALEELRQEDERIRAEVAFAVGEWGDEAAVTILGPIAKEDPAARVRLAAVGALSKIGGPSAVQVLMEVAADEAAEEQVRARAVGGLGGLALKEQEGEERTTEGQRGRGAVRTRGASPTQKLRSLLEQLRDPAEPSYVRTRAEGVLRELAK